MKDLEKVFFLHCLLSYCVNPYTTIYEIVDMYFKIGVPQKQLLYYLEKWYEKGFYDCGVNICYGWFYTKNINGAEYEKIKEVVFDLLDDEMKKQIKIRENN